MQSSMKFAALASVAALWHGAFVAEGASHHRPISFLAAEQSQSRIHIAGGAPAASPAASPSVEASEDDDAEEETADSSSEAPSAAASFAGPAPAPAFFADKDEDADDVGPQVPVVAIVTIRNMDYASLAADQSLHGEVEEVVRSAIAEEAGDDINSDDVALVSWPGSVRARAVIQPQTDVTSDTIVDELKNSTSLTSSITDGVGKLKGIEVAIKGEVSVDVDVMVATMASSVSTVMSRAKGQKHLTRVYELEKEAAAARQKIGDIALEGTKIDKRIEELEDEEAFQQKVDDRVKKIKKELAAPVFSETIGDMWKEMRMFGKPCYLKHLREEKLAVKERVVEAEQNATNIEEQLHDARDDVHDAWYPAPKSSSFKIRQALAASLASLAVALL